MLHHKSGLLGPSWGWMGRKFELKFLLCHAYILEGLFCVISEWHATRLIVLRCRGVHQLVEISGMATDRWFHKMMDLKCANHCLICITNWITPICWVVVICHLSEATWMIWIDSWIAWSTGLSCCLKYSHFVDRFLLHNNISSLQDVVVCWLRKSILGRLPISHPARRWVSWS